MKKKWISARKLRSRTGAFSQITEILVPTRFYWDEDGEFDGIEFGSFLQPINRYQLGLIEQALDTIMGLLEFPQTTKITLQKRKQKRKQKTPIPDVFLRAFKKDADDNV